MAKGRKKPNNAAPMATPCLKCPLRKIEIFRKFTDEELAFLQHFKSGELVLDAGSTIFSEGTNSPHLYTVLSGWTFKYKTLEDGRRQVLNFALPGDFIGLQASILDTITHSVEALTDVVLCVFPREKLWTLYKKHAGLAYDVTWLAAREESILGRLFAGRGPAAGRGAHRFRSAAALSSRQAVGPGAWEYNDAPADAGASGRCDRIFAGSYQQDFEGLTPDGRFQMGGLDIRAA